MWLGGCRVWRRRRVAGVGAGGEGWVGLALAWGGIRRRKSHSDGTVSTERQVGGAAVAVGGGAVALLGFGLLAALLSNPRATRDAGVVLFTFLALGWAVLPILTFASDDLLDPTRLTLLPLRRVDLMTLLAVGALVVSVSFWAVRQLAGVVVSLGGYICQGRVFWLWVSVVFSTFACFGLFAAATGRAAGFV